MGKNLSSENEYSSQNGFFVPNNTNPGKIEMFPRMEKGNSKIVWNGKKPRIKHQLLIDKKERGGFALPDLELYHATAGLVWLKEWLTLKDTDVLDLEGHDNQYRWHAYLICEKVKVHKGFLSHVIRK